MAALVIAEHDNGTLAEATRHAVTAALSFGAEVDLLVVGAGCRAVADEAAKIEDVRQVLLSDAPHYEAGLAEELAPLVAMLAGGYDHVVAAATTTGKNLLPRVAALLDVAQISDVIEIVSADTFLRPIYAGNALARVKTAEKKVVLTIRPTAFAPAGVGGNAPIAPVPPGPVFGKTAFVSRALNRSERPELGAARVVVSGGRGLGSRENFEKLDRLAEKLHAAIGASRAAVDAGYAPNDLQVGQTGKIVAPDLYIAIGISGAIQHLAGMKDSKVIVAINKDEDAPIFSVADYGLVEDLFTALPELEDALSKL